MTRVWVVGTVHAEQGAASVSRLHAILERIEPEVIFLELPPETLSDFLNGTRGNLESTAVRRYQETRQVLLVAVDLPEPDKGFFGATRDLQRNIERNSSKYRRLMDENTRCVESSGFFYLNSEGCGQAWSEIKEEMRDTVEWLDDRRGFPSDRRRLEFYESWTATHERREEAMLRSIDEHSRLQPFLRGVLLIGAAHRRSILTKARERRRADLPRIEGDLTEFSDVLGE